MPNNLRFTFISLNLFILIFFILLASYASLNSEVHPIHDIFRSFRGESLTPADLIVVSSEEQRFIKAKKYFKTRLDPVFYKQKLELIDNSKENILYDIKYDLQDLVLIDNNNGFAKTIKGIVQIEELAYGYNLSLEINLSREDVMQNNLLLKEVGKLIAVLMSRNNKLQENYIRFTSDVEPGSIFLKISIMRD